MAKTVVEELIVTVEANLKKLKSELKNAQKLTKDSTDKMKKGFDIAGKATGFLKTQVGGLLAPLAAVAGAAGIKAIVSSSLDAADAVAKLSKNIGIQAGFLQELRFAASQNGVAQNDLDSSMMRFNRRLSEAAAGNAGFKKTYDELGISVKDINGNIRDSETVFKEVADRVSTLGKEGDQARVLFNLFGDAGFKLVNLFKGGSSEIEKFQRKAREMGIVLSDQTLKAAEDANDQFDIMSRVIKSQLTTAVVAAAPILIAFANATTSAAVAVGKFFRGFEPAGPGVDELTRQLRILKTEMFELSNKKFDPTPGLTKSQIEVKKKNIAEVEAALADAHKNEMERKAATVEAGNTETEAELEKASKLLEERVLAKQTENEQLLQLDAEKHAAQIASNQAQIASDLAGIESLKRGRKEMTAFDIQQAIKVKEAKDKIRQAELENEQAGFNLLGIIAQRAGKGAFVAYRALMAGRAIISAEAAAAKALAEVPTPFNIPAAAAIRTKGLLSAATIAAQTVAGFQKGTDRVPGIGVGDRIPAMLEPNEGVVPRRTMDKLEMFLDSSMSRINGAAGGKVIVEFRPREFADFVRTQFIEQAQLGTSIEATA